MTKELETVCNQLVLRAIVWDVRDLEGEDLTKLERETELFGVYKIQAASYRQQMRQAAGDGQQMYQAAGDRQRMRQAAEAKELGQATAAPAVLYEKIQGGLRDAGILEETVLLVTDDAGLAQYVYARRDTECSSGRDDKDHDNKVQALRRRETGMGVVFYERSGSQAGTAADMAVLGFAEVGVQFLDRVLKRRNRLPWNILYTKRTCVREITMQDLDELYALYEGEGITDYTEPLFERKAEEDYTRSYIKAMYYYYGYGMWIIRDRVTGRLIGRAGIEHREVDGKVLPELGYIIGTEYQRQGYAVEVGTAILAYAKEELEMERLHCFIHPKNRASIRVAEKLGFIKCEKQELEGGLLHFQTG